MVASLKTNAYHVLGLDGSATNKRILQRSSEVIQRLRIGDAPHYDLDIASLTGIRTEELVRDSIRRLQAPKSRIYEFFFWFTVVDAVDREAIAYLAAKDYARASQVWTNAAVPGAEPFFRYQRHVAITESIALLTGTSSDQLERSLKAWKSIIASSDFWLSFGRDYKFDEAHTVSDETISECRANVPGLLSDIYVEAGLIRGTSSFVFEFQKQFGAKGERVERDILNPVYQTIDDAIVALGTIDVGKGQVFDNDKAQLLKSKILLIEDGLNKLIDSGLFDDSSTKSIRDRAASAIRSISVDLHNDQNELERSLRLLEVATEVAGTDSLKSMFRGDLEHIQRAVKADETNTVSLSIPGTFGGGTIVFKNDYLLYDNRKMSYKDAEFISYQSFSQSINLIPVSQSYSFMVASLKQTISLSFGTTLHIGNATKRDAWTRIVSLSQHLIEPHIVRKLVHRIFVVSGTVSIGGVDFNRDGYSRSKTFGGRESVSWRLRVFTPTFASGKVNLWTEKNGRAASFAILPMSTPNAVVLPDLVKACVAYVQTHA